MHANIVFLHLQQTFKQISDIILQNNNMVIELHQHKPKEKCRKGVKDFKEKYRVMVPSPPPHTHTPRHTQSCPICMLRYRSVAFILFKNPKQALDSQMDRWRDKQCQDSSIRSAFWQGTTKKFQIRLKEQPVLPRDMRQSKTLLTMTNMDQKSLETVFLIAICRQSGNKWQSKTMFLLLIYIHR